MRRILDLVVHHVLCKSKEDNFCARFSSYNRMGECVWHPFFSLKSRSGDAVVSLECCIIVRALTMPSLAPRNDVFIKGLMIGSYPGIPCSSIAQQYISGTPTGHCDPLCLSSTTTISCFCGLTLFVCVCIFPSSRGSRWHTWKRTESILASLHHQSLQLQQHLCVIPLLCRK